MPRFKITTSCIVPYDPDSYDYDMTVKDARDFEERSLKQNTIGIEELLEMKETTNIIYTVELIEDKDA